jgi:putative ABC transport system permease protein
MSFNLTALAWRNIRSRQARSWLTILGILIGTMAIVTLISIGTGVENAVLRQFKDIGLDVILLTPNVGVMQHTAPAGIDIGMADQVPSEDLGSNSLSPLIPTKSDLDQMAQTENGDFDTTRLRSDVPEVTEVGQVATQVLPVAAGNLAGFIRVMAPSQDLITQFPGLLGGFEVAQGHGLDPTKTNEILLGAHTAQEMGVSIGETITVGGTSFTVVGILAPSEEFREGLRSDLLSGQSVEVFQALANTDDAVFILYRQAIDLWPNQFMSSIVAIRIRSGISVTDTIAKINTAVARQGLSMTPISTQALADNVQKTLGMVKIVLTSIAAISLLVGTVGMMNTMYTAVLERTREIGILKSIGAKDRQVLGIFLIDSGLMGLAGGIFGLAIGVGVSFLGTSILGQWMGVTTFLPAFSPWLLVSVVWFSFVLGALAGVWPAWHAARLDPVRALASE